jgi:hypothetical protein
LVEGNISGLLPRWLFDGPRMIRLFGKVRMIVATSRPDRVGRLQPSMDRNRRGSGAAGTRRAIAVSEHLNPNLSARQIALRVLFSCAITALIVIAAFFTIRWLAGL